MPIRHLSSTLVLTACLAASFASIAQTAGAP